MGCDDLEVKSAFRMVEVLETSEGDISSVGGSIRCEVTCGKRWLESARTGRAKFPEPGVEAVGVRGLGAEFGGQARLEAGGIGREVCRGDIGLAFVEVAAEWSIERVSVLSAKLCNSRYTLFRPAFVVLCI